MASTAPEAPRPIRAKKSDLRNPKDRKPTWRERRLNKMKWWVTAFLAFVFILTSVAFFGSSPYSGMAPAPQQPDEANPTATPEDPVKDEIKRANQAVQAEGSADNYFRLGEAYFRANQLDDALKAYDNALAKDPNYTMALSHKGTVLLRQDKPKDALPVLEKAEQLSKATASPKPGEAADLGDINVSESLYEAYMLTGDPTRAKAELPIAAQIDIEHLVTRFMLPFAERLWIEKSQDQLSTQVVDDALETSAHLRPDMRERFFMGALGVTLQPMPGKEDRTKAYGTMLVTEATKHDATVGQKMGNLLKFIDGVAESRKKWVDGNDQAGSLKTFDDALEAAKTLPENMRGPLIMQCVLRVPHGDPSKEKPTREWLRMVNAEVQKNDPMVGKNLAQIMSILTTEPSSSPSAAPPSTAPPSAAPSASPVASSSSSPAASATP